ncbi:ABC transporter permease [Dyadobacter sandarakinus]|uniref:ABC transporter permease n=1 Tax=Dyadobacter sandarakinus TaxID=2747268 RepID=A0ABX7I7I1_9BACT|nr:ABC transporter permease [Dyadobacter sandarakinus]QRR01874.1 ABC transporter permease [Dyadobacter sandarakinus]
MLKNYFKIALRNIRKNKIFSAINIVGLAIGMASCILIMLFVFYEKSFDGMHTRNIYRLDEVQKFEGMVAPQKVALSMYPMGPTLTDEFPEITNFTRVIGSGKADLRTNGRKVVLPDALMADEHFFSIFDYPLIKGDRASAFSIPNAVILSEHAAKSLFGNEDPVGKPVTRYSNDTVTFKVTGVMNDIPANSHLQFDVLFSAKGVIGEDAMNNWGGNWLITYLELRRETDVAVLERKFPAYLKRHMSNDNWKSYELFLQPLADVHARSADITHDYLNFRKFDRNHTYIFSVIAVIVLVIACVNFMNLSTARSGGRAREVGVRKSIGAQRFQLAGQFMGESVLLALLSLVLAVGIVKILLPVVNDFSQRELEFSVFTNPLTLLAVIAGTLLIGLLSGIYPALFLSAFQPVKVLKGTLRSQKSNFRSALVIVQFSSAVFLMIATGFAVKQLRYMQQKDPGFVRDQVVLVPLDSQSGKKYDAIKSELLNNPLIEAVSGSQQRLGNNFHQTGVSFHGDGPVKSIASSQVVVDPDYLNLYKIKIVSGRNFSHDPSENAKAYIVNESLARELLREQPVKTYQSLIGRHFGFRGMDSTGYILGVAKDFNFNSLHHKIETLCLINQKDWGYGELSIRIRGSKTTEAIAGIRSVWQEMAPGQDFTYSFLDEHFGQLYRADSQVGEIVGVLAGLAIFVSCLGLFGLASYSAERRIKEIGVRKVLGASVGGIVALLSADFMKLVVASILIASPVAWWAVSTWLRDFAYRISIGWWIFALAGIAAVLVAFLTISFQSIRAALTNPVKSLRAE